MKSTHAPDETPVMQLWIVPSAVEIFAVRHFWSMKKNSEPAWKEIIEKVSIKVGMEENSEDVFWPHKSIYNGKINHQRFSSTSMKGLRDFMVSFHCWGEART